MGHRPSSGAVCGNLRFLFAETLCLAFRYSSIPACFGAGLPNDSVLMIGGGCASDLHFRCTEYISIGAA
jgi:hypothetical protein